MAGRRHIISCSTVVNLDSWSKFSCATILYFSTGTNNSHRPRAAPRRRPLMLLAAAGRSLRAQSSAPQRPPHAQPRCRGSPRSPCARCGSRVRVRRRSRPQRRSQRALTDALRRSCCGCASMGYWCNSRPRLRNRSGPAARMRTGSLACRTARPSLTLTPHRRS
eukprot:SAG31_NODE_889_length_11203_cov_7.409042_3_plen_164_part_00